MNAQDLHGPLSADLTPRIYVASLADYNAGTLHGRWIDATHGVDHIRNEVNAMLFMSDEDYAEEWAIHDYENFGSLILSERESFETVAEVGRLVAEHGNFYGPAFLELLAHLGGTSALDEARRVWQEHQGGFRNLASYGEWLIQDGYSGTLEHVPGFIRRNIDYDGVARDLERSGEILALEVNGTLHVFHPANPVRRPDARGGGEPSTQSTQRTHVRRRSSGQTMTTTNDTKRPEVKLPLAYVLREITVTKATGPADLDLLDAEPIILPDRVAEALGRIVGRYWRDELKNYQASSWTGRTGHICRDLYRVMTWLKWPEAHLRYPLRSRDAEEEDDGYFGLCPTCGGTDGYLNVGREHWGVCHQHRVRWPIGENLFSSWKEETDADWDANARQLERYQEVEPIRPEPEEEDEDDDLFS